MPTSQSHKSSDEDRLEKMIHQTLQSLPGRVAPASLEGRVMDKLARMDTGPWWRQPFAGWPLFVRMLFLVVSLTVTALVLAASIWVLLQGSMELNAKTSSLFSQIQESFSVMRSIIVQWVPTWMETGLQVIMAVAVVSYLAVLGLGAAIYNVVQPKSAVRSSHA